MTAPVLDERRKEVLRSLIQLHIETGEPVGSESLSRALHRALSPASLRNLMADRGQPSFALSVDQPDLVDVAAARLATAWADREQHRVAIERAVAANLVRMGRMGAWFVDHLRERHPDFPVPARFGAQADPLDHLPPPSQTVEALLARCA